MEEITPQLFVSVMDPQEKGKKKESCSPLTSKLEVYLQSRDKQGEPIPELKLHLIEK